MQFDDFFSSFFLLLFFGGGWWHHRRVLLVLFCKGGWFFVDLNYFVLFFVFLLFRPNYFVFSLFDFSFSNGAFLLLDFLFLSFLIVVVCVLCCFFNVLFFSFGCCCCFFLSHSSRFSQINHQSHCVFSRPLSSQFRVFFSVSFEYSCDFRYQRIIWIWITQKGAN